jgi:hypothetical protein
MSTNKQTATVVEKERRRPASWNNSHRKHIRVSEEKWKDPRGGYDCPAIIKGYSDNSIVTDFSFDGCFVEFVKEIQPLF